MRILIASSTYAPSMNGQAVFTTHLAEGLVRLGHEVVVVFDSPHGKAARRFENGVRIEELSSVSLGFLHPGVYFTPFPGGTIRQVFNRFAPEVVHIQDHYPICHLVVLEARRRGIPVLGSNHFIPDNLAPYIPGSRQLKPLVSWVLWRWMLETYRRVGAVTAQSGVAGRILKEQGLDMPILPISCGIDLQAYHPDPAVERAKYRQRYGIDLHKKAFLFLGRIDGEKRIDLLLRAASLMGRADIQLVVAGKGKVEAELKQLAAELGLKDEVRFTGFIPEEDVPGLMNSVEAFVMPSEAELLSISTLEALACARPVILAEALALPELVRVGENGYLFTPGNAADLAEQITRLADEPEHWEAMGAVSRSIAEAHGLEATVRKYENLYCRLVGQPGFSLQAPAGKESILPAQLRRYK